MQRDVIFIEDDGVVRAEILSDLDHHSAKPIREKIDERLRRVSVRYMVAN